MRDFTEKLGERLSAMAEELALEAAPAPAEARPAAARRRRRRPAILGGATAGLAAIGGLFALAGTSVAHLPIFDTPTTDASGIVSSLPQVADSGVDFTKAHAFKAPGGTGYVLTTQEQRIVCIALPDPVAATDFGSSCSTDLDRVEADGLGAESTSDQASTFAYILPSGATGVRLRWAAKTTTPVVRSGVVSETITAPVTLTWTVSGHSGQHRFEGPFTSSGTAMIQCSDGRTIEVPIPTSPPRSSGGRPATLTELRRQQCN